ncbi:hypothetical protein HDU87_006519 [Geranomyces variabilis]|uniref:ORC1/DEAH AAA+ ATPase domain-containing protein n=1 Tax=Geranomyces variabilis TaxID=109894 RepID=A0AAD5TKL7_9FUNG|nr:hypothetical protein HDU87_006519 [Geranomyces variabilis]
MADLPAPCGDDDSASGNSSSSDDFVDELTTHFESGISLSASPESLVYRSSAIPKLDHSSFESVDFEADPFVLPRLALGNRILEHEQKRLLVTAPPASGKSTMRDLLIKRLEQDKKSVYVLVASPLDDAGANRSFLKSEFKNALRSRGVSRADTRKSYFDLVRLVLSTFDYVFIDDAQRHFATSLAEDLSKGMDSTKARVVFFASVSPESSELATPTIAGRLSWDEFRLGDDEQLDFCKRIITWAKTAHLDRERLAWLTNMLPIIRADTNGHVGLLRLLTQELIEGWSKDAIVDGSCNLNTATFVVVSVNDPQDPTQRILEFATPVHRRFWFREAYPSTITRNKFDDLVGSNIDTWLLLVLQTFQPQALSNPSSHGNGTNLLPLEWTFQREFWRGASMTLPIDMRVAAEVSKVMDRTTEGNTRVDFWINSNLNWAVELVRNTGNKKDIENHLDRFRTTGGYYYNLMPSEWRVIDFRAPGFAAANDTRDGLIIVTCDEGFTGATVHLGTRDPQHIYFQGKVSM